MGTKKKEWTLLEAFKDKSMSIIVMTIIGTFGLNYLINVMMTRYLSARAQAQNDTTLFTRHVEFSFGTFGIILAIPVFIVILLLTYFLLNLSKGKLNVGEQRQQIVFRWSTIYGIVIGVIVWQVLAQVFLSMSAVVHPIFGWFSALLAPVIAIIVGALLNRIMVRYTGGNIDLVHEIESGIHDSRIKDKNIDKMINILSKGDATSIRGAKFRLVFNNIFGWFFGFFGKIIWFFVEAFLESGGSRNSRSSGGYGGGLSVSDTRKKMKSEAHAKADKMRSQANYTKKHYVKQANYNPKHAQSEYNRALRDEKAANEARDRANRM